MPFVIGSVLNVLFFLPVSTFYLSLSDFGVYALVLIIFSSIGSISSAGTRNVISGNYFEIPNKDRYALIAGTLIVEFILQILVALLLFTFDEVLLRLIFNNEYKSEYMIYYHIMILSYFFGAIRPSITFLASIREDPLFYNLIELSNIITRILLTVLFLSVFNYGLKSLFIGYFFSNLVSFILGIIYIKNIKGRCQKFNSRYIKDALNALRIMSWSNMSDVIYKASSIMLVNAFSGLSSLGLYSHSLMYKNIFVQGGTVVGRVISPEAMKIISNNKEKKDLVRLMKFTGMIITIFGVVLSFYAKDFVRLISNDVFTSAYVLIVPWLIMIYPGLAWNKDVYSLYIAKDNRYISNINIFSNLLSILLMVFLGFLFGMYGVVVSVIIGRFVFRTLIHFRAKKSNKYISVNNLSYLYSAVFVLTLYSSLIYFDVHEYRHTMFSISLFIVFYCYREVLITIKSYLFKYKVYCITWYG
mgnify:CR=1 FL=1|jgi:O-antigen/teichoic acid export membrane protein